MNDAERRAANADKASKHREQPDSIESGLLVYRATSERKNSQTQMS
jgi:hypothetical protein